jgi:hypothetical protein
MLVRLVEAAAIVTEFIVGPASPAVRLRKRVGPISRCEAMQQGRDASGVCSDFASVPS